MVVEIDFRKFTDSGTGWVRSCGKLVKIFDSHNFGQNRIRQKWPMVKAVRWETSAYQIWVSWAASSHFQASRKKQQEVLFFFFTGYRYFLVFFSAALNTLQGWFFLANRILLFQNRKSRNLKWRELHVGCLKFSEISLICYITFLSPLIVKSASWKKH